MPARCPHCEQEFNATRGIFGKAAEDLRDVHAASCEENPRNRCFCGRVFLNSVARDNHATTCEMNPINRFKCPHCALEFVTQYGMKGLFRADGRAARDAHVVGCKDNPANKCFCGRLFPDADARNAHATKREANPVNCFQCKFCSCSFVTTFNMLGFCANDGRAARDVHEQGCERNPKNTCFCGNIFPNQAARDKHAASCEKNPANRFECPHCSRLFQTRFGLMGMVMADGRAQRDAHEMGCERNPSNACFCGQRFLNPGLRDAHAVKCHMNPVNRYSCHYCKAVFVTKFGIFTTLGSAERDAHAFTCRMNPSNVACEFCDATFTNNQGLLKYLEAAAHKRCGAHVSACSANPKNRCDRCGCCYTSQKHWFCKFNMRAAMETHLKGCDLIPCTYQAVEADSDWLLLAEPADVLKGNQGVALEVLDVEKDQVDGLEEEADIEIIDDDKNQVLCITAADKDIVDAKSESESEAIGPEDFQDIESLDGSEGSEDSETDVVPSRSDASDTDELAIAHADKVGSMDATTTTIVDHAEALSSLTSSRSSLDMEAWEDDVG
mmetsp:Transcript_25585/g.73058  ORF Transcript_25585/g.73058 Transcript_25585/m.73058 type:complete len:554 (-) Transcript_25585:91-1752(-)